MSRRNGYSPDAIRERELAAVDAALAGKPVEAEFADLAELARTIRMERPRPRPGFSEALDARVRHGFRAQELRSVVGRRQRKRGLAPLVAGTAASLVIVVTAVLSSGVLSSDAGPEPGKPESGQFEETQSRPTPEKATGAGAERTAADDEAREQSAPAFPPPPASRGVLPHVRNRQVDRAAALTLAAPPDKVEETADGVIEVTDRYQGFVLRSNVTSADRRGAAGATLELRIPTSRLQPALRDLSALAHVRSRTQSSQDITARFISARSRLRDAVTERRALLRQLARATTPNETASIRVRLRLASRQAAAARANLRGLRNRVNFSTVSVTVEADDSLPAANGGWTPRDALDDAVGVLGVAAGVVLVSLAVLLPVGSIALLALLAYRRIMRERRDRALDF
jgi:hypothetical protein